MKCTPVCRLPSNWYCFAGIEKELGLWPNSFFIYSCGFHWWSPTRFDCQNTPCQSYYSVKAPNSRCPCKPSQLQFAHSSAVVSTGHTLPLVRQVYCHIAPSRWPHSVLLSYGSFPVAVLCKASQLWVALCFAQVPTGHTFPFVSLQNVSNSARSQLRRGCPPGTRSLC